MVPWPQIVPLHSYMTREVLHRNGERLSTTNAHSSARPGSRSRSHDRARHRISVEFGTSVRVPKDLASRSKFRWADAIPETEWHTYQRAIQAVGEAHIPFLLGGGFALATFTGRWRDTKDIDFYILPTART